MRGTLHPFFFMTNQNVEKCVASSVIHALFTCSWRAMTSSGVILSRVARGSASLKNMQIPTQPFTKPRLYNREAERIKYGSGRRFTSLLRSLMDGLVTSDDGLG